ncbi:ABC transporter ATP-binding protein [Aquamicrobium defluvii]|uniref:ABC transporter ATP-binding protein n=1 Tax=Aquamicrobium defluvii TaxID=69279 RepID=A0A011TC23_9HYPH|nr:ABC transporter ATP-binding protein [Aquamicrobium defluvii]EXL09194.1 ABC transporter ATP-binding protein [Aquamicrobium defluvii]EZQ17387.1 ABC transporter ATP-binding protein [Halopseudomonas bauzanensis]TDR37623.1 ATP-binding cassette subfamily B protein [Aquamicrobium defluvii]
MSVGTKSSKPEPGEVVAVLKRIFAENGREYIGYYAFTIFCLLVSAATAGLAAWIMQPLVDDIFVAQRYERAPLICGAIIAIFLIRGAATYGYSVTLAKIGNNVVARYQKRVFQHLMRLGMDFFSDTRSGRLAARINENVAGIRDLMGMTLRSVAGDLVALVGLIGVMIWQQPFLAASIVIVGPPLVWAVNYIMRRVRSVTRESVTVNSHLIGAMQEAVQGIAVVKAFTMEEQLAARIGQLVDQAEGRYNKIARVSERLGPITESLAGFAVAGVIGYASYKAATTNHPPGDVMAFITALLLAYDPARRLARTQVNVERALVNARMIYEILDLEPRQGDVPDAGALAVPQGEVRFEKVSFSYVPGQPVLNEVSFTAAPGRTTAIVGASGAGKSTLVALLQRFYDVDGGAITIDGQDVSKVTKRSLRQSIAYVSQQPYLFEGSIRDNIRYGRPDASDREIELAARLAAADEFIRQQPEGYDTQVGENGASLSGGQRQRVSIARAIVRDAPILLLDEATSALDNESEARVQQALNEAMRGRTTIVIAHRLSTVVNADSIVVLEQGRVVEQGTHTQLMAEPNGVYARFYRFQGDNGLGLVEDVPTDGPADGADTSEISGRSI